MQTTKPETAQQRPTGARMALLMLLYFIKIGAFTFGSGWSIIAQMQKLYVEQEHTITSEELLDLTSVGRSLPGTMIGNVAMLYGYRVAGIAGGMACLFGMILPPMVVLLISLCLFRVVWIQFVLPFFAGIEGVFVLYPVSWALGAVLMALYAWKGSWMTYEHS